MIRNIILLAVLTSLLACTNKNLLTYHSSPYFKEKSTIEKDSVFTLYQSIFYNAPNAHDEEYGYSLELIFLDTSAAKNKKVLNLRTDKNIVIASADIFSIWNFGDDYHVSGTIEILSFEPNAIVLKENVRLDWFNPFRYKRLKGIRTFARK